MNVGCIYYVVGVLKTACLCKIDVAASIRLYWLSRSVLCKSFLSHHMAMKKIIAICQSGGEFETNDDGSLSYNGGDAYALDLDNQMKLSDFKKELADTFHSSVDGMLIKYFLPGNKKTLISISKDKDFKRMINFFGDSDQVDVFVMIDEGVARNMSNMPVSRYLQLDPA